MFADATLSLKFNRACDFAQARLISFSQSSLSFVDLLCSKSMLAKTGSKTFSNVKPMRRAHSCDEGSVTPANPYEMRTKSIRVRGAVTSVGLENFSWDVLSFIAHQNGLTLNQQVCRLHESYVSSGNSAPNFCSFLRIACMLHLADLLPQQGTVPTTIKSHESTLQNWQR